MREAQIRPLGPGYVDELKYDGFRTIVRMDATCQLLSRNANPSPGFEDIRDCLQGFFGKRRVITDAEIVCVDENIFPSSKTCNRSPGAVMMNARFACSGSG